MNTQVRVRFAPSPTGGLHIGGVRTVLFNYLFAKKHKGTFVLRIEDTDQSRFVAGAEEYIFQCLAWCGLNPDESVLKPGEHAPYRQSERKAIYWQYAQQLIAQGHAYYAFDTPEELEKMREQHKSEQNPTPQYNHSLRKHMRNSLTMSEQEVAAALTNTTPFVIRLKVPENRLLSLQDMIRGEVTFDTNLVDDKVLLKADGMPTYHLAVVVDDYLMKISHAFRGEEWLPSAPIHLLLWEYLGWQDAMPQWAHLPLILKPDGHGKLSKRDGDRLGFPVFAMNWEDPKTKELNKGFKEIGFLPGDLREKMEPWMQPVYSNFYQLYNKEKIDKILESGQVEIVPLAFMRGRTFLDAFIIVDEAQNCTNDQMEMITSRLGLRSKMVVCGDSQQVDLKYRGDSGFKFLVTAAKKIKDMDSQTLLTNHRHPVVDALLDAYEEFKEKSNPTR